MAIINFTPFPDMETETLNLRQVVIKDENEIFLLKSDEKVLEFLDSPKAKTIDEAGKFINKVNNGITNNEWILWGIALKGNCKLIGTICLWNFSEDFSKAELGFELMPCYQGKGIMQEALRAVIKYGFENLKLQIIEATTNAKNSKSIKLLERNDFIKKEDFKESCIFEGKSMDFIKYYLQMNKIRGA